MLKESGLARATVSKHLKELEDEGVVERAIENRVRRPVYRLTLNEEKIDSEFKRANFDWVLKLINYYDPTIALQIKIYMKPRSKIIIENKRRKIEGKPGISEEEIENKWVEWISSIISKEDFSEFVNAHQESIERDLELGRLVAEKLRSRGISLVREDKQ